MSSYIHGTNYEKFVKTFLVKKYKHLWLWHEIPANILHTLKIISESHDSCDDIGCDILAETNDGQYHFIQCKNYSTLGIDNTINICDLAGFYNFMAENNFVNGFVYYTGRISSQVIKRSKSIKYVNLPYNICEKVNISPYSYQIDAFNKLACPGRNILTMPCGTGKTYVSYLLSASYKNIIVLSPLISTAEQLYLFYKQYYTNSTHINICVFNCMNKHKVIDLEKQNVIISTYDSVNLIFENVSKLSNKIIIIDEYHNLSQNNLDNPNDYINKLLTLPDTSYLFMSATPHKKRINYPLIFGNNEYYLSWEDAIINKYICDYSFCYPNPNMINNKINELKHNSILSQLEVSKCILLNKAYYLLECIKEFKLNKVIVFLKTVIEAQEFIKIISALNVFFDNRLLVGEINYNTTKTERNKVLTRFKNKNETINILCNVHILDEGIDIPECDSVYLTHPNYNPINFIQRISRCNRLKNIDSGQQNIAHVLIWAKTEQKVQSIDKLIGEYLTVNHNISQNVYMRSNLITTNTSINNDTINLKGEHSITDIYMLYENLFKENSTLLNLNDINVIKKCSSINFKFIDHLFSLHKNRAADIEFINTILSLFNNNFCYNNTMVTVIFDENNKIWFSLSDVFRALGYADPNTEIKRIDIEPMYIKTYNAIYNNLKQNTKYEKQKNIQPHMKMTDTTGIYIILSNSKKVIAKQFRDELCKNIMPKIPFCLKLIYKL